MLKSCCQHDSCGPVHAGHVDAPAEASVEPSYQGPAVPLTELRTGQAAIVRVIDLDARDSSMLRAMGLRVNSRVRICRLGEPCIIELVGGMSAASASTEHCPRGNACTCRIGLSKPLAKRVLVGVG